jgi:hypothetical protein
MLGEWMTDTHGGHIEEKRHDGVQFAETSALACCAA